MAYAIVISTVFSPLVVLAPITHLIISLWFFLTHKCYAFFVPATIGRVLSTGGGGGGAGRKLLPQTPKLRPQILVTDHGIQEILGLNHIKSDFIDTSKSEHSWGILPQTPYTMCTSVVSYIFIALQDASPPKVLF